MTQRLFRISGRLRKLQRSALKVHADETYWRPALDILKLKPDGDEVIVGCHYRPDDDVSRLDADTWQCMFCV